MTLKDAKLNQVCSVPRSLHPRGELDKKPLFNSILITGGTEEERLQKALGIRKERTSSEVATPNGGDSSDGGERNQRTPLNDPDFILLASATSIGIDQVRDLQRKLSLKPFQSPLKIAFVLQAQNLTHAAQNALLKTLEEPPKNTIIILSSPHADNLLPTIISRCQIINLAAKPQISQTEENLTAHYSLITNILQSRLGERILLIQPFTKSREEATEFCQNSIFVLHGFLKGSFPGDPDSVGMPLQAASQGVTLTKKLTSKLLNLSPNQIIHLLKSLQKALNYLQKNINVKLVMENMILNW